MANTNDEILDLLIKRDLLLQRVGLGLSKDVALKYIKMNIETAIAETGLGQIEDKKSW